MTVLTERDEELDGLELLETLQQEAEDHYDGEVDLEDVDAFVGDSTQRMSLETGGKM